MSPYPSGSGLEDARGGTRRRSKLTIPPRGVSRWRLAACRISRRHIPTEVDHGMLFGQALRPPAGRATCRRSTRQPSTFLPAFSPLRGTQAARYTDVYLQPHCGMRNSAKGVCVSYSHTPSPYQATELSTYRIRAAGAPIFQSQLWRERERGSPGCPCTY